MINAVLIDDEKNALEMLEWQLKQYCSQVRIAALCKNADEGIQAVEKYKPHLLFLDIEMPRKSGFEVIAAFPDNSFDVIFTTAYNQFAIKAFKFSALDYLMKPIDAEELIAAVQRYERKANYLQFKDQLQVLLQQYKQPQLAPDKIAFATQEGIVFIQPEAIIHCESFSNYTTLFLLNKPKLVISKTLKEVEELLQPCNFFRVHHSHLINLRHVTRYIKADGGCIEMIDGAQLPVSRQRKDFVLEVLMKKC